MKSWLLDTGPIVAYLDASDPSHDLAKAALTAFEGDFITTSAVVIESMHFLKRAVQGPARLVEFLEMSETHVADLCEHESLRKAVCLMQRYADIPMDFADATLVLLGDKLSLNKICTFDCRGFSAYRTAAGKRFNLVLDEFSI